MYILFFFTDLVNDQVDDLRTKADVTKAIRSSIMSKQYGNEDFLAGLITDACSKLITLSHAWFDNWLI